MTLNLYYCMIGLSLSHRFRSVVRAEHYRIEILTAIRARTGGLHRALPACHYRACQGEASLSWPGPCPCRRCNRHLAHKVRGSTAILILSNEQGKEGEYSGARWGNRMIDQTRGGTRLSLIDRIDPYIKMHLITPHYFNLQRLF